MKKILPLLLLLISLLYVIHYYNCTCQSAVKETSKYSIQELRERHAKYLENSPFKESLKLTKEERKVKGLPPNKYYEEQWELTMNPVTGKPEPQVVLDLQLELMKSRLASRVPGDKEDNKWVDRGPNNVGGRTRVVLFDPNDPTHKKVYAGAVGGGLWYTNDITDQSASWYQVNDVPGNMNISCITVDPRDSNVWYIGTGELYTSGAAVGNGVYKTTNGGVSWNHISIKEDLGNDLNNGIYFITSILAYDKGISTDVFVGVGSHVHSEFLNKNGYYDGLGGDSYGLYKSIDNGNSWSQIQNTTFDFIVPNDFEVTSDNTIWMSTTKSGGRLFKSPDGVSWAEAGGSPLPASNRVEIAVSSTNPNKIYALTEGVYDANIIDSSFPHIYVSEDGFETFVELARPDDADYGISAKDFTRGQSFYDLMIEVDPNNDEVIYVGGIDLFRTDKGAGVNSSDDWRQISKWSNNPGLDALTCSYVHADQHAFTFHPTDSNKAIVGCDGGVFYGVDLMNASTNDVFYEHNYGYNVTQFYYGGYGQDITNELILAGAQDNGTQFINRAQPGENAANEIFGGDGVFSTVDKDGDYMIVSYIYNNYFSFKLPYDGQYFQINGANEGKFINPAGLDHNLNILFSYKSNNAINRYVLSENTAIKQQILNESLSPGASAFKVSPFNSNATILYVGTAGGKLLKITNAHLDPSHMEWQDISGDEFLGSISDIEFGATENDIFVTFYSYGVQSVWYTSNGGITWHTKEGDLPNMPVRCILQNPLAKNEVIIGTELGVWRTENFHEETPDWIRSDNGMRDVKVVDLDLRKEDNKVLATTHGRGVFTGVFTSESSSTFTFDTENSVPDLCGLDEVNIPFKYNATGGFNEPITVTLSGLPENATALVQPNNQVFNDDFQVTLGNLNAVKSGEYIITINASGGAVFVNKDIVLFVNNKNINPIQLSTLENEATGVPISNNRFSWEEDINATSYDLEIAKDPLFENKVEVVNIKETSYFSLIDLEEASSYFWRVRGVNDCVIGEFSEVYYFKTNISCLTNTIEINQSIENDLSQQPFIYESKLSFSENLTISDLRVKVDLYYENIDSMQFLLISPDNTQVKIFDPECGNLGSSNLEITFEDHAENTVDCNLPTNFSLNGRAKPFESLSLFNNKNMAGEWTLRIIIDAFNTSMFFRYWSIGICSEEALSASQLITDGFVVEAQSKSFITQNYLKAFSVGSRPSQQVFTLLALPEFGMVNLRDKKLMVGDSFTQLDINEGLVSYTNVSDVAANDFFEVDIKNETGGYIHQHKFNIEISESFKDDDGDGIPNENDSCLNTSFNVKVDTNGCFVDYFSDDDDEVNREFDLCPDTIYGKEVNIEGCSRLSNYYVGTVAVGGKYDSGIVFKIDKETKEYSKLLDFEKEVNGQGLQGGLMLASNGRYYGVTDVGGKFGYGVLYELDVANNKIINKHDFNIARNPRGKLTEVNGKLYGLSYSSESLVVGDHGAIEGTLYEYDIANDKITILKVFNNPEDGSNPMGKLAHVGNSIYGTAAPSKINSSGVLFKYDLVQQAFTKIHDFGGYVFEMVSGGVIEADNGKLYGYIARTSENNDWLLFEYDVQNDVVTESLAHDFFGGAPLLNNIGYITKGNNGLYYGTSGEGGSECGGVIFSYNANSNDYKILHDFGFKSKNSWLPTAVLVHGENGSIYGMTSNIDYSCTGYDRHVSYDTGSIFEYNSISKRFAVLHRFKNRAEGFVNHDANNHLIEIDFDIIDKDWDHILNYNDNCPDMANHNQKDLDGDGIGDVCDDDIDGDEILNDDDNCPYVANNTQDDLDGDGIGDVCDDDIDGDSVLNDIDLCSNSALGTIVDINGCDLIPPNNFSIETIGETCPDKNNGRIIIMAAKTYDYEVTFNGIDYDFTTDLTIDNLAPGNYEFCITIPSIFYEQCFAVQLEEGTTISGKSSVKSGKVSFDIVKGTAPFNVSKNGKNVLQTYLTSFSVDAQHGDLIEVKTDKACEGVLAQTIEIVDVAKAYPNPTKGNFEIALPTVKEKVRIDLYTIQGKIISTSVYNLANGRTRIDINDKSNGIYFVKAHLEEPVTLKIIKQ